MRLQCSAVVSTARGDLPCARKAHRPMHGLDEKANRHGPWPGRTVRQLGASPASCRPASLRHHLAAAQHAAARIAAAGLLLLPLLVLLVRGGVAGHGGAGGGGGGGVHVHLGRRLPLLLGLLHEIGPGVGGQVCG